MIVFEHQFDESSCGCVFEDAGGVFTRYDEFRVLAEYVTECFTAQLTDGTSIEVRPTPTAAYSVPDSLCVVADVVIVNNSSFSCDNTSDPQYQLYQTLYYNSIQPEFYYDFVIVLKIQLFQQVHNFQQIVLK